ncbi:hypothetical protein LOK49_LG11G00792 [Camellia lanceoleosa]|uniref:Uncharacterized protein n=1 Tax=Camellia lanceoleosa TaxID=1840588 RepID=A0ACC0FZG0_9ERIC|nr:hypothetical protein LOK49_LG11G00792 [Camellia lanceoleosa]
MAEDDQLRDTSMVAESDLQKGLSEEIGYVCQTLLRKIEPVEVGRTCSWHYLEVVHSSFGWVPQQRILEVINKLCCCSWVELVAAAGVVQIAGLWLVRLLLGSVWSALCVCLRNAFAGDISLPIQRCLVQGNSTLILVTSFDLIDFFVFPQTT